MLFPILGWGLLTSAAPKGYPSPVEKLFANPPWVNWGRQTESSGVTDSERRAWHLKGKTKQSSRNGRAIFFLCRFRSVAASTSTLLRLHYNAFHNKMRKQPRVPHTSSVMHMWGRKKEKENVCTWPKTCAERRIRAGRAKPEDPRRAAPETLQLAGPDTQSRNAFKRVKKGGARRGGGWGRKMGRTEREREGAREKRRVEKKEWEQRGTCASLC